MKWLIILFGGALIGSQFINWNSIASWIKKFLLRDNSGTDGKIEDAYKKLGADIATAERRLGELEQQIAGCKQQIEEFKQLFGEIATIIERAKRNNTDAKTELDGIANIINEIEKRR